jgi:hypothetical protein
LGLSFRGSEKTHSEEFMELVTSMLCFEEAFRPSVDEVQGINR